jgi:hypothetical protein
MDYVEVFRGWSEQSQLALVLGTLVVVAVFAYLTVRVVLRSLVCIFRGYPSQQSGHAKSLNNPDLIDAIDCNHEDNLSGVCLMERGNCRTQFECNKTIEEINRVPARQVQPQQ